MVHVPKSAQWGLTKKHVVLIIHV